MAVFIPTGQVKTAVDLCQDSPVYQVIGLQYLHSQKMEIGRHHIIFLTYADYVGVGIIGVQDRIDVCAVALVAPQILNRILRCCG